MALTEVAPEVRMITFDGQAEMSSAMLLGHCLLYMNSRHTLGGCISVQFGRNLCLVEKNESHLFLTDCKVTMQCHAEWVIKPFTC